MSLLKIETITLTRKAAGTYVNGHYVEGAGASSSIEANVQPLTGNEVLQLPEADRYRESWKVFSSSEIRVDDVITRSGKTYVVGPVKDYSVHSLPHYEAIMLLIEGQ